MANTNKQGQNEQLRGERITLQREAAMRPATVAEFYLAVGQAVRWRLRHGLPQEAMARGIGLPVSECMLALRYAESPDWLKLRALVEDWLWKTIKDRVQPAQKPAQRMSG